MSGGQAGIPLDVCIQQMVAGDPYWSGPRGERRANAIMLQIAAEWRVLIDEKIVRLQQRLTYEDECG